MRTFYKTRACFSFTVFIIIASASTIAADDKNMSSNQGKAHIQTDGQAIIESPGLAYTDVATPGKTIDQVINAQPDQLQSTVLMSSGKTSKSGNPPPSQEVGEHPQEDDDC